MILPNPTAHARMLISRALDAATRCGEWTRDEEEPYQALSESAQRAEQELLTYVATLEQQANPRTPNVLPQQSEVGPAGR